MPRLVTASGLRRYSRAKRPAIQSAARNAMATSTPYVWRNERWKISGYIRGLPFRAQEVEQQQSAADHDGGIRHIECRPLVLTDVEKEEVGDASPDDAVEHVARRAAEDQREAPEGEA